VIALSTGSLYSYGVARVFALAAQAGFDGIEVLIDERWDTRQAGYLRGLTQDHGIPISSLHNPFVPHLDGWPRDPVERLKTTVSLAQALGVETVVVHLPLRVGYVMLHSFRRRWLLPAWPSPFVGLRRWMAQELTVLEASSGVRLCVENMPARRILGWRFDACWWNTPEEWSRFPHLTLDTTHLGTWGLDPLAVYRQVNQRVCHVHLSNFNGKEHRRLEDGHLPLAELLQALREDNYQGVTVVELGPDSLEAQDETQVLAHLKGQVAFCRQHFA
jgi:sugar phosphate isomerase/epimerase